VECEKDKIATAKDAAYAKASVDNPRKDRKRRLSHLTLSKKAFWEKGVNMLKNGLESSVFVSISIFLLFSVAVMAGTNPAVEFLDKDVGFYLHFNDGTLFPEMSIGQAEPVKVTGTPSFAEGRFGKALILGGEDGVTVEYKTFNNINFFLPGAMSFWMAPQKWLKRSEIDERGLLRFFNQRGAKGGAIFIQRQGFVYKTREDGTLARRNDMFQVGYYGFPNMGNTLARASNTLDWADNEWRFFVINWSRDRVSLNINGKPVHQVEFSRPVTNEDFPGDKDAGLVFTLSTAKSAETTLFDEFVIYRRPLDNSEIEKVYKASLEPLD
jgi:hypothetical protein